MAVFRFVLADAKMGAACVIDIRCMAGVVFAPEEFDSEVCGVLMKKLDAWGCAIVPRGMFAAVWSLALEASAFSHGLGVSEDTLRPVNYDW